MTTKHKSTNEIELPKLVLSIEDMDTKTKNALKAVEDGTRVLGGSDDDATRALFDGLPGAIASRVRKITPDNFTVAEIEIKLQLSGNLPGLSLGGDVVVKLHPIIPS